MTKKFLTENKVEFNELQIADYADILRDNGFTSAPVVQIIDEEGNEDVFSGGFHINKLRSLVND